jgi:hypothetical protein
VPLVRISNAIIAGALLIAGCSGPDHSSVETDRLAATLAPLDLAHPENDAQASVAAGDKRFICVFGFARLTPGVNEPVPPENTKCLDGTSDAIEGDKHLELIQQAQSYARAYNLALINLMKVGTPPNKSLERSRDR